MLTHKRRRQDAPWRTRFAPACWVRARSHATFQIEEMEPVLSAADKAKGKGKAPASDRKIDTGAYNLKHAPAPAGNADAASSATEEVKDRGYRPRVPLKPAPVGAADAIRHDTPPPSSEQKDLVRQVTSGAIISVLWRWGRRMGYDSDGAIIYYSGEDEYFRAKIMQWRKVHGRRLFRLIYDDGYCENRVSLLDETFRIVELQDSDVVCEEGGLFLV